MFLREAFRLFGGFIILIKIVSISSRSRPNGAETASGILLGRCRFCCWPISAVHGFILPDIFAEITKVSKPDLILCKYSADLDDFFIFVVNRWRLCITGADRLNPTQSNPISINPNANPKPNTQC
jgi:hypothetical protein